MNKGDQLYATSLCQTFYISFYDQNKAAELALGKACRKQNFYFPLHSADGNTNFHHTGTGNNVVYKQSCHMTNSVGPIYTAYQNTLQGNLRPCLVQHYLITVECAHLKCYREAPAALTCGCAGKWCRQHDTRLHITKNAHVVHCTHTSVMPVLTGLLLPSVNATQYKTWCVLIFIPIWCSIHSSQSKSTALPPLYFQSWVPAGKFRAPSGTEEEKTKDIFRGHRIMARVTWLKMTRWRRWWLKRLSHYLLLKLAHLKHVSKCIDSLQWVFIQLNW